MHRLWRTTPFRLTMAFCAIFIGAVVVLLWLIYVQTAGFLARRVDFILTSEAAAMAAHGPQRVKAAVESAADAGSLSAFGLYSPRGQPLVGDHLISPSDLALDGRPRNRAARGPVGPQRALARRLPWGQILVVRRDASQLMEVRSIILMALLWSGGLIILVGVVAAVLLGFQPLRRVRAIQAASEGIATGEFGLRLPLEGSGDELDELARIVNVMMDEVQRLMMQAQSFGEAIAHELRSPLTRLRTTLDHAAEAFDPDDQRQELLYRCVTETDSLLARFRTLLRIAAVEARNRQSGIAQTSLSAIVEQVAELYAPLAVDQGIAFRVDAEPDIEVRADAGLIFEAVSNLVDNALKYTPAGGRVRLALTSSPAGPVIEVRDTGMGIAPEERALVTKRFYRSQAVANTPGHGLGLSLVTAVADLHGFKLTIDDASPGARVKLICAKAIG